MKKLFKIFLGIAAFLLACHLTLMTLDSFGFFQLRPPPTNYLEVLNAENVAAQYHDCQKKVESAEYCDCVHQSKKTLLQMKTTEGQRVTGLDIGKCTQILVKRHFSDQPLFTDEYAPKVAGTGWPEQCYSTNLEYCTCSYNASIAALSLGRFLGSSHSSKEEYNAFRDRISKECSARYPQRKRTVDEVTLEIREKNGIAIPDAEIYIIRGSYPHGVVKGYGTTQSNQQGIVNLSNAQDWKRQIFMPPGTEFFFWSLCVQKKGYETYQTYHQATEELPKRMTVNLEKGEFRRCLSGNPHRAPEHIRQGRTVRTDIKPL